MTSKSPLWHLLLPILFLGAVCAAGSEQPALRFAPLPMEDRQVIREQFFGLAQYLSEVTGRPIAWIQQDDYADILQSFRDNEIDLAYLGPLPLVMLMRADPAARPLGCFRGTDGAAHYTCSLVVFGEAGARAASELRHKRFGLTQPYSTCGWFATSRMLAAFGTALDRDGNQFDYTGSHSAAALGVVAGDYDVAGVKTAIARRYAHMDLHIIATSRPYPGFALVANTETLDTATLAALEQAVGALDPQRGTKAEVATRMRDWGGALRYGMAPTSVCDYSAVERALSEVSWPPPGARQ